MYPVILALFCCTICALNQNDIDDTTSLVEIANRRNLQTFVAASGRTYSYASNQPTCCASYGLQALGLYQTSWPKVNGNNACFGGNTKSSQAGWIASCDNDANCIGVCLLNGFYEKGSFAVPNRNCQGYWSSCTSACEYWYQRTWTTTVTQSGNGQHCPTSTSNCYPGQGACRLTTKSPTSSPTVSCDEYAPSHVGSEIDNKDSYIAGDVAWLVFNYPSYADDVELDFKEQLTSVGYYENGVDANGWTLETNADDRCLKTLKRDFTFEELKNNAWDGSPNIVSGNISFWLDFKWNEDVSDPNFGIIERNREQDLPFTLRVQRVLPVVFSLDVSWTPTNSPSSTPSIIPSVSPSKTPSRTPSALPSRTPSRSPSETPSCTPSSIPSIAPSRTPSLNPSLSPSFTPTKTPSRTPSLTPSLSPSFTPTKTPSRTPSITPSSSPSKTPSSMPTTSPHPPSKAPTDMFNVVWMINSAAQENNEQDIPWIELEFTTASNGDWRLTPDDVIGNITQLYYFTEDSSWDCTLPTGFLCQKWVAKFSTPVECDEARRSIDFNFIANIDGYNQTYTINTYIGGSSAFVCAQDLGAFALTSTTRFKTAQDNDYTLDVPSAVYIDEPIWFRISFASSAELRTAELNNFRIVESVAGNLGNEICDRCHDDMENFFSNNHTSPDRYEIGFNLTSKLGFSPLSYTFEFDFTVVFEHGATRRRRLSIDVGETKETSIPVTLFLQDRALAPLMDISEVITEEIIEELPIGLDDVSQIHDPIPFEMRFDYDFALVAAPEDEARFLQECSDKVAPLMCVSVRPGSIIVTFLASSLSLKESLISDLNSNGFELPSFGQAKTLNMKESATKNDINILSAGNLLVILGLCVIAIVTGIIAYCRANRKKAPHVEENEAIEIA